MAKGPDSEYEYKTCVSCNKSKKVYDKTKPELLWHWDEWFIDHSNDPYWHVQLDDTERQIELKEALHGCCLNCRRDVFDFYRRMNLAERLQQI